MSTGPWWNKRKGGGRGKGKKDEPAAAEAETSAPKAAPKPAVKAPPPPPPAAKPAPTKPFVPKAPQPKTSSKTEETERKRKLSDLSQLANGSDEFSAPFKPPPGKYVVITDTSMAAQGVFDRLEGGLRCSRAEKVEVIPLISGIADLCAYHSERALRMYDDEVARGVGNAGVQTQDSAFIAKYRTRRMNIGFSSPNVGWLSKSIGNMTLPSGEKAYSGGPGFIDEIDDEQGIGGLGQLEVGQNGAALVVQRFDIPAAYEASWLTGNLVPLELLVYLYSFIRGIDPHDARVAAVSAVCYPAAMHGQAIANKFEGLRRASSLAPTQGGQALLDRIFVPMTDAQWSGLIFSQEGQNLGLWANADMASGVKGGYLTEPQSHGLRLTAADNVIYMLDPAHLVLKYMNKQIRGQAGIKTVNKSGDRPA